MNRYLLDTTIISELRKPRPHGGVVAWLHAQQDEQLYISAVSLGEVQAGIERIRAQDAAKADQIERWLDLLATSYQILAMDAQCFREWGRLMSHKPDRLVEDAMIAATARTHNLIIASRNERDFSQFDVRFFNPFRS